MSYVYHVLSAPFDLEQAECYCALLVVLVAL